MKSILDIAILPELKLLQSEGKLLEQKQEELNRAFYNYCLKINKFLDKLERSQI